MLIIKENALRRTTTAIIFLLIVAAVTYAFYYANSTIPLLRSGDSFPEDLGSAIYSIDLNCYDEASEGYHTVLSVPHRTADLYMTVFSSVPFTLICNDTVVRDVTYRNLSTRTYNFVLTEQYWSKHGVLNLLVLTSRNTSFGLYFANSLQGISLLGSSIYFFVYGFFLAVFLVSILLFAGKRSEKYLMILAGYTVASIFPTLFTLDIRLFNITFEIYSVIRNPLNVFSHAFRAFTCVSITGLAAMQMSKTNHIYYYISSALMALFLLLFIPPFNNPANFVAALLSFVLGGIALVIAFGKKQRGALVLLVGYACSCSVSLYGALVGRGVIFHYLNPYVRVALMENIPFILACLIVTLDRFSNRFSISDIRNIELNAQVRHNEAQLRLANEHLVGEQLRKHNIMTNIFHDLRNPIFAIKGCVDMLVSHTPEDERLLGIIQDRLSLVRQLTEDLFLISKLEEGQITFLQEQVDVSELCLAITGVASTPRLEKSVSIQTNVDPDCIVLGDAFRLRQAVENLLNNAVQYSPEYSRIDFSVIRDAEHVLIRITDQGSGIAPEDISRIFDRYYHHKLADKHKSSGLGLTIALEIIHKHHGHITVDSKLGKGSIFTIYLPACGH